MFMSEIENKELNENEEKDEKVVVIVIKLY